MLWWGYYQEKEAVGKAKTREKTDETTGVSRSSSRGFLGDFKIKRVSLSGKSEPATICFFPLQTRQAVSTGPGSIADPLLIGLELFFSTTLQVMGVVNWQTRLS
jgi:hypothetical protein